MLGPWKKGSEQKHGLDMQRYSTPLKKYNTWVQGMYKVLSYGKYILFLLFGYKELMESKI